MPEQVLVPGTGRQPVHRHHHGRPPPVPASARPWPGSRRRPSVPVRGAGVVVLMPTGVRVRARRCVAQHSTGLDRCRLRREAGARHPPLGVRSGPTHSALTWSDSRNECRRGARLAGSAGHRLTTTQEVALARSVRPRRYGRSLKDSAPATRPAQRRSRSNATISTASPRSLEIRRPTARADPLSTGAHMQAGPLGSAHGTHVGTVE